MADMTTMEQAQQVMGALGYPNFLCAVRRNAHAR